MLCAAQDVLEDLHAHDATLFDEFVTSSPWGWDEARAPPKRTA